MKPGRLNVSRKNCFIVLARQQHPGESHGKWEPISTSGFTVVCHSKYMAVELCWFVAPKIGYSPPRADMTEEAYLDWLLDEAKVLQIVPYEARGDYDTPGTGGECPSWAFYRGWYPDAADILEASDTVAVAQMALKASLAV